MAKHNFPRFSDVITVNGEQYKLTNDPYPTEDVERSGKWCSSQFHAQAYSVAELNSNDPTIGVYNICWVVLPEYANVSSFSLEQWEAACDWSKPICAEDLYPVARKDIIF